MTKARDLAGFSTSSITNTATDGLVLAGDGSSTDVVIKNGANATVASIPDGSTNLSVTGSVTGALARGAIQVGDSSGVSSALTAGGASTVLTSDGTDLSWAAPAAGGAMEFISSQTPSSGSTVSFTGFDKTKYINYKFEFSNIRFTADDRTLYFRTSSDGGSNYDAGGNDYETQLQELTTSFSNDTGLGTLGRIVGETSTSTSERGIDGTLTIFNPGEAAFTTTQGFLSSQRGLTSAFVSYLSVITRVAATEVNAIQFGGGTFASGTISMYGLKKS